MVGIGIPAQQATTTVGTEALLLLADPLPEPLKLLAVATDPEADEPDTDPDADALAATDALAESAADRDADDRLEELCENEDREADELDENEPVEANDWADDDALADERENELRED